MKILIVEPDKNLCRAMLTIFEMAGHDATCAHDGQTGVKLAYGQSPQFVFCDIKLPSQSGYEVLRIVRENFPPAALPFVLMAVYLSADDMAKGLALGATGFLIKPFTDTELLRKLETASR